MTLIFPQRIPQSSGVVCAPVRSPIGKALIGIRLVFAEPVLQIIRGLFKEVRRILTPHGLERLDDLGV